MKFISISICIFLLNQFVYSQTETSQNDYWEEYSKAMAFDTGLEFDSALIYYREALKIATESANPDLVAFTNRRIGAIYIQKSQIDTAKYYLKIAIKQAIKIGNDTIHAAACLPYGWIMNIEGKTDSAFTFYNKSLAIYKSIGDTVGMAKAYTSFAIYFKNIGDFDKGLENALKSATILKSSNDIGAYINSLVNLGNMYEKLGQNDTALACYDLVYQLCVEYDKPQNIINALINRGVIYYRMGKYEDTKREFLKAIEISQKLNEQDDLGLLYSNISIIYRILNEDDKAIESANKALEIAKDINDVGLQLRALNNLGICYKKIENYSMAIDCYLESLDLAIKLKYKEDRKKALNNLSNVYETLGDFQKALEYNREATIVNDSILNETKIKAIEETNVKYETLLLKDQNRIKELEKKQIRFERNLSFGLGITGIVLLILLVIALRNRARKNRIIAAQKIQQLEDEKRILAAQSVIVGQEEERKRIAQELHDGIGVLLSTASIHFSSLSLSDDPEKTRDIFFKATKMLNEASTEVRKVSHNMMPGVLSKFGLKEAIEDLFEKVEETGEIKIDLSMACSNVRLPDNLEIMIYRIVQEMINNTLKHAEADEIKCSLKRDQDKITINFSDNGKGFDTNAMPHNKSLGIFGIRSRVDFLGGTVELKSEKDIGTTYSISIPLVQNAKRSQNKKL